MSGVLNFTMGLANGGFMGPLGGATAGMSKMLGIGTALAGALGTLTGLGAGFAGVMSEINQGGRLFDLSKRSATGVRDLATLEHAFNDVGVGAGSVAPILAQLQKSLGGVNEQGEPTNETFKALGLSIEQLKAMQGPEQIQAIGTALAKLGKEDAMAAAAKIVSRGSAGDLLQIARSADDFGNALAKAAPQAAILARNAAAFDKIGDTLGEIKLQSRGLFAGIAEGAAPGIQALLNKINNLDLTGLGVRIGGVLTGFTQAFNEGQLSELVALGLGAGFEKATNFFRNLITSPDLWSGVGQAAVGGLAMLGRGLIEAGITAQNLVTSGLQKGLADALASLGDTKIGKMLGLGGMEAPSFKEIFDANQAQSGAGINALLGTPDEFFKNATSFMTEGGKDFATSVQEAWASSGGVMGDDFVKKLAEFQARAPKPEEGATPGGASDQGKLNFSGPRGKGGGPEVNALERIGLVNVGGNRGVDYQRRSATSLERIVVLQEKMLKVIPKTSATTPDYSAQ